MQVLEPHVDAISLTFETRTVKEQDVLPPQIPVTQNPELGAFPILALDESGLDGVKPPDRVKEEVGEIPDVLGTVLENAEQPITYHMVCKISQRTHRPNVPIKSMYRGFRKYRISWGWPFCPLLPKKPLLLNPVLPKTSASIYVQSIPVITNHLGEGKILL